MINKKSLYWYVGISFVVAWILFLMPLAFTDPADPAGVAIKTGFFAAAMWAPGLAAILVTLRVEKQPFSSLRLNRLGEKKAYLWAWFLPPVLAVVTGLLTWATGLGKFDPAFPLMRDALASAPGGAAVNPALVVLAQSAFALLLAPFLNVIFALGEELGWRGFLLPRLLPLGTRQAVLVSGLIWGIWHAPAILQGHNYPNHPVLGVFLMMVFTVLLSVFLSWVTLRTGSPWAAALGHGSINAVAGLPVLYFLPGFDLTLGGTLTSVTGMAVLGLFAAWILLTGRLEGSKQKVVLAPVAVEEPVA